MTPFVFAALAGVVTAFLFGYFLGYRLGRIDGEEDADLRHCEMPSRLRGAVKRTAK